MYGERTAYQNTHTHVHTTHTHTLTHTHTRTHTTHTHHTHTQVHGDVFRPPANASLLATFVGTGVQLFGMAMVTMTFALLGFLSPANRGGLMTVGVLAVRWTIGSWLPHDGGCASCVLDKWQLLKNGAAS